jgi:dipeptidyl aminopeptidase/acylaminoacyl peptidase
MCSLAFEPDAFFAGVSVCGVADAEALARDTHKFESRYLDSLVGPYPEQADVYRARSPVNFPDSLARPMLLLQGLDDEIVPPAQSEGMAEALARKGIPHAYLAFEGEGHGFRRAETIVLALEAELYFVSRIFGFEPADAIEPFAIDGLAS